MKLTESVERIRCSRGLKASWSEGVVVESAGCEERKKGRKESVGGRNCGT